MFGFPCPQALVVFRRPRLVLRKCARSPPHRTTRSAGWTAGAWVLGWSCVCPFHRFLIDAPVAAHPQWGPCRSNRPSLRPSQFPMPIAASAPLLVRVCLPPLWRPLTGRCGSTFPGPFTPGNWTTSSGRGTMPLAWTHVGFKGRCVGHDRMRCSQAGARDAGNGLELSGHHGVFCPLDRPFYLDRKHGSMQRGSKVCPARHAKYLTTKGLPLFASIAPRASYITHNVLQARWPPLHPHQFIFSFASISMWKSGTSRSSLPARAWLAKASSKHLPQETRLATYQQTHPPTQSRNPVPPRYPCGLH